jgi:cyanophycinase
MSGWLALHGGSGWLASPETARQVLGTAQSLVVLPTAAAFEGPDEAVASAVAWFGQLSLSVTECRVLTRHDANDPANAALIRQADALLFTGGQPLHLRSVMSESLVWAAVTEAFATGVPIIAEGDAASAFGDPMLDPRGGAFTIGLGLAPGLAILPGSDTWLHDRRVRTLRLAGSNSLALVPSTTTLLRDPDGKWSSSGNLAVTFVGEHQ